MAARIRLAPLLTAAVFISTGLLSSAPACCPAPPPGQPVLNADQTVLIIWDAATKTQHFIRQASFKSESKDFGFLVPSPTQPKLQEAGNEAFPVLMKLTEPEVQQMRAASGLSCGCGILEPKSATDAANEPAVTVLEEKIVAGFQAAVLEAASASDLLKWLTENGYAFSPEVEAWAEPYVEAGWTITALKVASSEELPEQQAANMAASALRMTFTTDRPLFPYREPDPTQFVDQLNANNRLLRIYFIGEARYQGEFLNNESWNSRVAWSDKIDAAERQKLLALLQLPPSSGPSVWWLTEFEHDWPYEVAPGDVYFSPDPDQGTVKRPPIIEYVSAPIPADATFYAFIALVAAAPLFRRRRQMKR